MAALDPADAARKDGVPVTSPARTLLDLAATASTRDLNRAADEARVHRLVTDLSLNEQFQRYPHHRGTAALTKAIQTEPALTRSEAERQFLELIRAARLPEPETNARVGRWEVDSCGAQSNSSSKSTATRSTRRAVHSSAIGVATGNSQLTGFA